MTTEVDLRIAWEAGFCLAREYGDNHVHFAGEQRERHWRKFLANLALIKDAEPPRCSDCGYSEDDAKIHGDHRLCSGTIPVKDQRDDEAWMHAACLTIAETGQKWGESVHPSPAMQAVYNLFHEYESTADKLSDCWLLLDEIARRAPMMTSVRAACENLLRKQQVPGWKS